MWIDYRGSLSSVYKHHVLHTQRTLTPCKPFEQSILDFDTNRVIGLQPLQDGIGCLHTPQCWGAVDVVYGQALLLETSPGQLSLEQPHLCDGGVLGELARESTGDFPWHV